MGIRVCCRCCMQHACTGNPEECSGSCLPSVVPHHHQETDGKRVSKKVIKQTHPYPIMPYALSFLNRKFLISLYPFNSFNSPPLWKDDMTTEVWKAFPYFCNTQPYILRFFQGNWHKTAQSYTGQRHSLSSVTWAKVLEQPQVTTAPVFKQTLPGSFWLSHRSALNVKRSNRYSFLVYIRSAGNPLVSALCPPAQGSSPGALCANRASCMTASFGWIALGSGSMGTGDPSLDRLSGVWTPLECADNTPEWLGEAGALL